MEPFAPSCLSAITNLVSVADTTLSENFPSNNFGKLTFVNAGMTQNFTRNRGLFRFDIAAAIPPNSVITSVTLTLEVTHQPSAGYAFADFSLHRVLQPWGEGSGISSTNSSGTGEGSPATTNEATWLYRFAFTTNVWSAPGAGATNDYIPAASASQTIYGTDNSPYTFGSSAQMAADVQSWLVHPAENFGWILICDDNVDNFTARRFASREDPNSPPQLSVRYLTPPELRSVMMETNQIKFCFTGFLDQYYVVEFSDAPESNSWQVLTNIGGPPVGTSTTVADPILSPRRFYRLRTY